MTTNYAPLIETLVAFFDAVDTQHRKEAMDPAVRARIHEALDMILDGRVRFRRDGATVARTNPNNEGDPMTESTPETNVESVEGDVNVTNEAPATEATTPSETPAENGDTNGDDAQQDTGALQE